MSRKTLVLFCLLITFLLITGLARAQQPQKVPRIGFLFAATPSANSERLKAFRQGLRERGYVEEKNILLEQRYAEGNLNRIPALAAELVQLKVDVIVSVTSPEPVPSRKRRIRFPL